MDKKLKFAEKYNWWSQDKNTISFETKLSYVLGLWNSEELFYVFKNIDFHSLKKAYSLIKEDSFMLKKRRKAAITQLMIYKKNKDI